MSSPISPSGIACAVDDLAPGGLLRLRAADVVDREEQVDPLRLRPLEELPREVELVRLDQALPDRDLLRLEEGVGHGAADEHGVRLGDQVLEHLDLVGDLGAAEERHERALRRAERLPEVLDLLDDEEAGRLLLDERGHAGRRGVGAVGRAEGVVDVDVAERRQLAAEASSFFSSSGWKRRFSSRRTCPSLRSLDQLPDAVADAVVGEDHVLAEQLREAHRGRLERELRRGPRASPWGARGATRG